MKFEDNFNGRTLDSFWARAANYSFPVASGNGILAFNGGSSFNFNPVTFGIGESRGIETRSLDLRGGSVAFDLLIGGFNSTPWGRFENADSGEDVRLSYSIDGGTTFINIRVFDTEAPATLGRFGRFSIDLPDIAQTESTILRWSQITNSGSNFDHWALDNVSISGLIEGTPGDDILDGSVAPDLIFGLAGNDTIRGLAGDDVLDGGAGADSLDGGDGIDTATYESATSGVRANLVDPTVNTGDAAGDTYISIENLTGSNFNDILIGDGADNELYGRSGDDVIDGGLGQDTARFGNGGVTVDLSQAGPQMTGEGTDTLTGIEHLISGNGNDTLTGDGGDNILTGGAGDDALSGGAGNDMLHGGSGTNTLTGGLGDDTFFIVNSTDQVLENIGEGTDTVRSSVSYSLGARGQNVENLVLIGTAAIDGSGNGADNLIIGNNYANTLFGGFGTDTLNGFNGNDSLSGGQGEDILNGGRGEDSLDGGEGNDLLLGGGGNDLLDGGEGSDRLNGGGGADIMTGGTGDDVFIVNDESDRVRENAGEGTDTVLSIVSFSLNANSQAVERLLLGGTARIDGAGNGIDNVVTGNNNVNTLSGGLGNDVLNGRGGMDSLFGGAGNDRLNGGIANDVMTGGLGDDIFVVDRTTDLANELDGEGYDTVVSSAVSYSLNTQSQAIEAIRLAGTADIDAAGNNRDNFIGGQSGDNTLIGAMGDDVLIGNGGNDVLDGGAGNDVLNGGLDDDRLTGGLGRDRFVFDEQFGNDTILGLNLAEDVIDLRRVGAITDFTDLMDNHLSQVGSSAVITNGTNTITLNNIADTLLAMDDFLF